jgi:hypothetical protein
LKSLFLSLDLKIMISAHIISEQNIFFENMILNHIGQILNPCLDMGYERGLGLRCRLKTCRLLEGSKQKCGC